MKLNSVGIAVATALAMAPGTHAIAQQSGANDGLEEIVVTSRRVTESLQDVPVSVNVMDNDFLREQQIMDVNDVLNFSPGGSFTQFNKMQSEYGLRGVSSQSEGAAGDSSVVTVIDNVPVTHEFMKNPSLYDMARVEVLRGPQGTSFGRNASSGLVHLVTARPEFESSGQVSLDVGDYGTLGGEAYVTGGLSENVAGRLAINYDTMDGYTRDTRSGNDLGGTENIGIRGSLLFNPSDEVSVYLKVEHNSDNDDSPAIRKGRDCSIVYQGDFPQPSIVGAPQPPWTQFPNWTDSCDPWETQISEATYLGDFFLDRDINIVTAEISWQVTDDITLTSVTGYMDGESDYLIDAHGGPNNSMFQSTQNEAETLSQEIRLDNNASGGALRWLAGIYLMGDEQTRNDQNIFYVDDAVGDPQSPTGFRPEGRDVKQQRNETSSIGIFGELNYDFTDRLSGSVGVRWSEDEKDYSIAHFGWGWGGPIELLNNGFDENGDPINGCVFAPSGPPTFGDRFCGTPEDPVGFTDPTITSNTWDNTSFRGSLQFQATEEVMVYGAFSQGYKTGGFQSEPTNPIDAADPYNEETVDNFEIGLKSEWGGRLRLNLTAFTTDYQDLQLFIFRGTGSGNYLQLTANAADAEISGVEAEFVWQANDYFSLSGTLASVDAELVNAQIDVDGDEEPEDFNGTRPDNTTDYTATLVATVDIPLSNGSLIDIRADWRGNSDVFDDIGEDPNRRHDSYNVIGARARWTSPDSRYAVTLWGRNLTEEAYTVNVGPYQPNLNQLNFSYAPPRVVGANLTVNF